MDGQFPNMNNLSPLPDKRKPSTHLGLEQLADYHFGKLSLSDESLAREHLVTCQECALELIGLAAFCDPEEDDLSQPSSAQVAYVWSTLQTQTPPVSDSLRSRRSSVFRLGQWISPPRLAYLLAAASIVLTLSLGIWLLSLNRKNQTLIVELRQGHNAHEQEKLAAQNARMAADKKIEEALRQRDEARDRLERLAAQSERSRRQASEPQLKVSIADLVVDKSVTRGSEDPKVYLIELSPEITAFTLIIPWFELNPPYSDYAILIKNRNGATILNRKGLHYEPTEGFTPVLPRRLFPAGEYSFSVYGLGHGGKTTLQEGIARISYKKRR